LSWGHYNPSSLPFNEGDRTFATEEARDEAANTRADELRERDMGRIAHYRATDEKVQAEVHQATRFNDNDTSKGGCISCVIVAIIVCGAALAMFLEITSK
jgi:hypothetical protein